MEFVEPIRDKKKIAQIKNMLRGEKRYRDLLLFVMGINTALRISDLLDLRIGMFVDTDGSMLDYIYVHEQKTDKRRRVKINDAMKDCLQEYLTVYPAIVTDPNHYIFFNVKTTDFSDPIKRGIAWRLIAEVCQEAGLRGNFGTHSLRKTWGYQARMGGVDLGLIMKTLNHSNLEETKRYLGITDDELAEIADKINL